MEMKDDVIAEVDVVSVVGYDGQELRWICVNCNSIMDRTNYIDYIRQSDNDKKSNQEAKINYHDWHLLTD
jgi:hypothetical protein